MLGSASIRLPWTMFALPLCPMRLHQHKHITQQPRPSFFSNVLPARAANATRYRYTAIKITIRPPYHHTIPLSRPLQLLLSTTPPKRSLLQPLSTATSSQLPLSITTQFETQLPPFTVTPLPLPHQFVTKLSEQLPHLALTSAPFLFVLYVLTPQRLPMNTATVCHHTTATAHPTLCNHTPQSRRQLFPPQQHNNSNCLFPIHHHAVTTTTASVHLDGGVRFCSVSPVTDPSASTLCGTLFLRASAHKTLTYSTLHY